MNNRNIYWDIETGPLHHLQIEAVMPEFEAPANLKDPAKIAAAIEEKRQEFIERAPLDATTGMILAVGFMHDDDFTLYTNDSHDMPGERHIIGCALQHFMSHRGDLVANRFIGHNTTNFDIPFIVRRAMFHGLWGTQQFRRDIFWDGRYLRSTFVDTMQEWAAGEYGKRVSLNTLSKLFGLGEKQGTGDQFHKWFCGGERDRALDYLREDLRLVGRVAERMGL